MVACACDGADFFESTGTGDSSKARPVPRIDVRAGSERTVFPHDFRGLHDRGLSLDHDLFDGGLDHDLVGGGLVHDLVDGDGLTLADGIPRFGGGLRFVYF